MDPVQQSQHEAIASRVDRSHPNQRMSKEERVARAREMYELYITPPGKTLEEVGERYGGLSKERIRQIFNEHGFAIRNPRPYGRTKKESHSPMVATETKPPQVEIPQTTPVDVEIDHDWGDLIEFTCLCGRPGITWVAQGGAVDCPECGRSYNVETKIVEVAKA